MTTPFPWRAATSISLVFSTRMLGLFMLLPILSIAAQHYPGATPFTLGLALGVYGLTQACLQIPFGWWSDRWQRKAVITVGLAIFAAGSVFAANAHTMTTLIIGRALQGAGAIGSPCIALLADLSNNTQRTRVMAILGLGVGLAFTAAMVMGPVLQGQLGLPGLFWLIAGLACLSMLILWFGVPQPPTKTTATQAHTPWMSLLCHPTLWRLNAGIAILHACLTMLFSQLPLMLKQKLALATTLHWHLYLPTMALGFVTMLPLIVWRERKQATAKAFGLGIVLLAIGSLGFALLPHTQQHTFLSLWLFFTGFNLLEALLPSSVSKAAAPTHRGAAMGLYSTAQFMGVFVGGLVSGYLQQAFGGEAVWWGMLLLCGIWLSMVLRTQPMNQH